MLVEEVVRRSPAVVVTKKKRRVSLAVMWPMALGSILPQVLVEEAVRRSPAVAVTKKKRRVSLTVMWPMALGSILPQALVEEVVRRSPAVAVTKKKRTKLCSKAIPYFERHLEGFLRLFRCLFILGAVLAVPVPAVPLWGLVERGFQKNPESRLSLAV